MKNVLVYIAGPISKGDLASNVKQACDAGVSLIKAGIPVIVPHLTCYLGQRYYREPDNGWDTIAPWPEALPNGTKHEDWYDMDAVILARCDALLRLPGESVGADLEESFMRDARKPIFRSVEEVIAWATHAMP